MLCALLLTLRSYLLPLAFFPLALGPWPFAPYYLAVDRQTQREFLIDIEDLVEQLFSDTEELRRLDAQGSLRRELLDGIFRHVHSIKGVAATADFKDVSKLAHQIENLLDSARAGRIPIEAGFVELLEEAASALSESLSLAAAVPSPTSHVELIQRMQEWDQRELPPETNRLPPDLPPDFSSSLNENEKQALLLALQRNEKTYLVTADFSLALFDQEFNKLRATLAQQGAVISSLPSLNLSLPDRVSFRVLYSSDLSLLQLQELLEPFTQVTIAALATAEPHSITTASAPLITAPQSERRDTVADPAGFVRIEIEELDRLISNAHELFGQTARALHLVSDRLADDSQIELRNLDAQIRESLFSLEEKIIQLRMVSLDRVLQRAVRAGHVAARVVGREVEISVAGHELRIDKLICDAIADPLLHLVRNAVDQGIESPAERVQAGKPPAGQVRIQANSAGGRVWLSVFDDGRGIDPKVVTAAALKHGFIEEGTVLNDEMSLRMIFRPGFSTTGVVSEVSGRGVGLDIVERDIERVGGAVRVRTQLGEGSEFEIRLPATLGVLHALVVVGNGHRYCVDSSLIVDRCDLGPGERRSHDAGQGIHWRGQILPSIDLDRALQIEVQPRNYLRALICDLPLEGVGSGTSRYAILIEGVEESQEVLVRGLGRHAAMWTGVAGAAELWNGEVALVLDLPLLLSQTSSPSS